MNVQSATTLNLAAARRSEAKPPTPPAPTPDPSPAPQHDSFGGKVGHEAIKTGIAWGNAFSTTVGGATGLATMTGALYAGVLGGAVTGAALGMGFGPVLSSVTTHGAFQFIGQSFATAGLGAKAGMIIGGVSGAAGAWQVGNGIGGAIGKGAGFVLGAPVGAVQGAWGKIEDSAGGGGQPPSKPDKKDNVLRTSLTDLNQMHGGMKLYASVVGGVGMLSGAVGGFTVGASVASAGSLVSGLLAQNVSLSHIGGVAMMGGVVGGALFATIGGLGGFNVAKGSKKIWDLTGGKLLGMTHGTETMNQKADRLNEKEKGLRAREATDEKTAADQRAAHAAKTAELDAKESQISASEKDVQGRLDSINNTIETNGQAQYKERAGKPDAQTGESLINWNGRLDNFEGKLNITQQELKTKEQSLDTTIESKGNEKYQTQLRPPLENEYQGKQSQLNDFESRLNGEEQAIATETTNQYNSQISVQKPPLDADLSDARSAANQASQNKSQAQNDESLASTLLATANSNLSAARGDRDRANQRLENLNHGIQELNIEKQNLQNEHAQADATTRELQSELSQCQAGH